MRGILRFTFVTVANSCVCRLLPANTLNHIPKSRRREALFSFSWILFQEEGAPLPAQILAGQRRGRAPRRTILFIPLSVPPHKLETDWAASCAEVMLRRCPVCEHDSIIGHGRRRKQAHDEHHDWIGIRRGRCPGCGKTFTFLPLLSLPYTHYSLLARCQALRRRFVEHCSWEEATPTLKDPNRVPDPSTLRRWSHGLDRSQPALSFLRQTLASHDSLAGAR